MKKDVFLSTAILTAKKAGSLIMKEFNTTPGKDSLGNPSIKQDRDSELLILKLLRKKYPDHGFLGEEFGEKKSRSGYKWIIDPIDGTNNYTGGRDTFSISIGLEKDGEIIMGVVYLPKRKELFYATLGNGAFLNDKPIEISSVPENIMDSVITYSTYPGAENIEILNNKILNSFPNIKYFGFSDKDDIDPIFGRGSMAAEFCYLACGRIDGLIRLKQKPWDVAAGSIIATEAGAKTNNLQGDKCIIYKGDYIAANPKLLEKINQIIRA